MKKYLVKALAETVVSGDKTIKSELSDEIDTPAEAEGLFHTMVSWAVGTGYAIKGITIVCIPNPRYEEGK